MKKSVSIGFYREDGDFQILATLNNRDELIEAAIFNGIITDTLDALYDIFRKDDIVIEVLEREDAPDYVTIEE